MARLRRAGHEDSVLDEVSPPLRGLASDFGKTQSHQRSNPPLVRPPASGSLGSPICPTARAHLGEQQGATPNPQHRGRLTALCIFGAKIERVVISYPAPHAPHSGIRLSQLCNKCHWRDCIGEKIIVSTTTSGTYPYRGIPLY